MPQSPSPSNEDQYLPPKSNKRKRVAFDTAPPQVAEAAARSMDELLRQRKSMPQLVPSNRAINSPFAPQGNYNVGNLFNTSNPPLQPLTAQDTGTDPIDDADIETDTFKNVNIDSILHNGVSNLPPPIPKHRASFASMNNDSPSPSPPITGFNHFSQVPPAIPTTSEPSSAPPRPPPLPPKVRVSEPSNGPSYQNGYMQNSNTVTHSPLPLHANTGPSIAALVPTPTGPVLGKNTQNNIFGSINPNQPPVPSPNGFPFGNTTNPGNQGRSDLSPNAFGLSPQPTGPASPRPTFGVSPQPTGPMNSFGISPQPTGPMNSYGVSPQPTGPMNSFGVSPQPTGMTQPPPVPAPRTTFGTSAADSAFLSPSVGNSPSPSLAQFGSLFQGPGSQSHSPLSSNLNLPATSYDQRQQIGSPAFQDMQAFPQPFNQVQAANNPAFQSIPPPPPRRSVSGGSTSSLQSIPTGNQFGIPANGGRAASLSSGPVMSNGLLAPPPPPARRRLLSASNVNPSTTPLYSSSASNLPGSMGPPGTLQNQFTGQQPLYSTPTGSNSVPNLLTNGMQNFSISR